MKKTAKIAITVSAGLMLVASLPANERPLTQAEHQEIVNRSSLNTCGGCHRLSTLDNIEGGAVNEDVVREVRQLLAR